MLRAEVSVETSDLTDVGVPDADASAPIQSSIQTSSEEASDRQIQESLAAELAESRQVLDGLTGELRAVDGELDDLATEREQARLVVEVCSSLDKLGPIGGAFFWGEGVAADVSAEHARKARARVDQFNMRVAEIEGRRAAVVDQITQQQGHVALMEDVLFEALEEEERRKQEWIIEREISQLPAYKSFMPWTRGGEDDKRFRKSVSFALVLCFLFAVIVPFIQLPQSVLKPEVEIPDRIVRLLIESKPKPPVREQVKPKAQEKLAEKKPVKEDPRVAATPDKETPKQEEKAAKDQGILAFREKFAAMQEDETLARLGAKAQINNSSDSGPVQRSMLTTNAPGSSGGINLASLSRGVGGRGKGDGMAGVQVTRVTSGIGGIGKPGSDRPLSGDGVGASRTDEEIQIVFDRYKSALYRLYNKELRKDPTLRGQMVLRLTIEPDGSVSLCAVQGSDMNAPELSAQVVDRVKTINFGAKEGVSAITILYPIDFLPAA